MDTRALLIVSATVTLFAIGALVYMHVRFNRLIHRLDRIIADMDATIANRRAA